MKILPIIITFVILSSCFSYYSNAQEVSFLSWIENTEIPSNNKGVTPEWTVRVDDNINGNSISKLFVYGPQGILIYNLAGGGCSYSTKIEFSGLTHGYFERINNSYLVAFPAHEPMLYINNDEGVGKIFAVGSDLKIWYIDPVTNAAFSLTQPSQLNGCMLQSTKITYDPINKRLAWLANVYSAVQDEYFAFLAIYNLSSVPYTLKNPQVIYGNISDFAFNNTLGIDVMYLGYTSPTGDFYWQLRKRSDLSPLVEYPLSFAPGLIKYVHTNDIHLAYCLPGNFVLYPGNPITTYITILDGNSNNPQIVQVLSPSPHFTSAAFNDEYNHLYLGAYPYPEQEEFQDFYAFQCSGNPTLTQIETFNTNRFSGHSRNMDFYINCISDTVCLLMKRHEIVKVNYNPQQPDFSYQQILPGYGEYFRNAVTSDLDSRVFVTDMVGGGFIEFDSQWASSNYTTGEGIFSCFISSNTGKYYYFTKKHVANGSIHIDEHNMLGTLINFPVTNPIGDCIFNPFQNHILVSHYLGSPYPAIKAYPEVEGGLGTPYTLQTGQLSHLGEMYVSQLGELLYLSGNDNIQPKMTILDAQNYGNEMGEIQLSNLFLPSSDNLKALFASNPYQTYFVISDDYDPESDVSYPETSSHSYFYVLNPEDYSTGESIEVNHDQPRFLQTMYSEDKDEGLILKAFVAGTEHYITELTIDSYLNINPHQITFSNPVTAMKFVSHMGYHELYIATWPGNYVSKIYRYNIKSGIATLIAQISSRISSMDFNEEEGLLYLYGINEDQFVVHQIDVYKDNPVIDQEEIHLSRMFQDKQGRFLDPLVNNMIFDVTNHEILIPNGEFSTISKLKFDFDRMPLKPGISWISFPRLNRDELGSFPADEALNDRIFPEIPTHEYAIMNHLEVIPGNPNTSSPVYIEKLVDEGEWTWENGNLVHVSSKLGYVITFANGLQRSLELIGPAFDPEESFPIYSEIPNWTGYFLPATQSPFDAVAQEFLDNISWMAGQYWFCHKESSGGTKSTGDLWRCACEQGRIEINYGEMIKILPYENITGFHWQTSGQPSLEDPKLAAEYYRYQEQTAYEPFLIEMDTVDFPLEIAAFAGDSCIGATKVNENDTLVLIRGFTEGFEGEPISFEMYYGAQKNSPNRIHDYLVSTPGATQRQKRMIVAGEEEDWYDISFKNVKQDNTDAGRCRISCIPNPFRGTCTIHYFLPENGTIKLEVLDILGTSIRILEEGYKENGAYQLIFCPRESGLGKGMYLVRLTAGQVTQNDRIIHVY